MRPSPDAILGRAQQLLTTVKPGSGDIAESVMEGYHGTLNLIQLVYGSQSTQESQLVSSLAAADKKTYARHAVLLDVVAPAVVGALNSLIGDVSHGLTGNMVAQASGEVLGDFLGLAKAALSENGPGRKNVAAVLVAAAFEDTLRRLAELKAGVTGRPRLEEVIGQLKTSGVLVGAAISTANGYLKFRNDSLHADWENVNEATIASCLAFVEVLLLQHFS